MTFQVDAGFRDFYAFTFEELALERGVGLADEDFAALTNDAMPGDAFSRRSGGHGAACAARAAREAQRSSERPVG